MERLHQPGDMISEQYRIIDTLGQGGVGITYKADDLQSGERVALKALSLRRMTERKAWLWKFQQDRYAAIKAYFLRSFSWLEMDFC